MTGSLLSAEQQLFARMVNGDHAAFVTIYEQNREQVFSLCVRLCNNADVAKDITQSSFTQVWKKRECFCGKEQPVGYLYRLVRNQLFQYLRKTQHSKEILVSSLQIADYLQQKQWDDLPDDTDEVRYQVLDDAIGSLPPKRKEIFLLHRLAGMSHQHIADTLHISKETVSTTIKLATRHLRNYVQERSMST